MKHLFAIAALLCSFIGAKAGDITYDFSTAIPQGWTSTANPAGYETTNLARGTQFTATTTLTLAGQKGVSKVVINCSTNSDKNSLEISVGGKTWGSEKLLKQNDMVKTYNDSKTDGDIVISITRAEKSIYIKSIVVTSDATSGGGGGDQGGDKGLDPSYKYGEPTTIGVSGETCSNMPYTFVQNNIHVQASAGAQNESYFGCNAGGTITFTATQAIKGIVVNGYIKKDFTATASNGNIEYADASEDYVEANPVLIVTDINNKSITINCVKQLRCYSVEFYFEENPDAELGDGGGDNGDLTYTYEPTSTTTINQTFTYADYSDFSADLGFSLTDLYFENDDYVLEMYAFLPSSKGTGIAPGTYTITDTYEEGTIQASPGGNDEEDYPSYLSYYTYDETNEEYVYNCSYYLVSGTLKVEAIEGGVKFTLDGKSYNGSTIRASYSGEILDYFGGEDGIHNATTTSQSTGKFIDGRRIIIRQHNGSYDLNGRHVR